MPVSEDTFIEVEDLSKTFHQSGAFGGARRTTYAVEGVSFAVRRGESLGIAGESGSGKSTLARMVVGLETPTNGRIVLAGDELPGRLSGNQRERLARLCEMVFQDPYISLDPRQTVRAGLDEVQRIHFSRSKTERDRRTQELLDAVGLGARYLHAVPRELSGGQRQRVAIARALAPEPQILILDEAVSALDVSIQAQILNLLADLRGQLGLTYLFISHDLAVVRHVAERVLILYRGRVMEEGPVALVFESPRHPYTQLLLRSVPRPGMALARGAVAAEAPQDDGCYFRHRCPYAYESCSEEPPLFSAEARHSSRCWRSADPAVAGSTVDRSSAPANR